MFGSCRDHCELRLDNLSNDLCDTLKGRERESVAVDVEVEVADRGG